MRLAVVHEAKAGSGNHEFESAVHVYQLLRIPTGQRRQKRFVAMPTGVDCRIMTNDFVLPAISNACPISAES
jgi:hypothetical protein